MKYLIPFQPVITQIVHHPDKLLKIDRLDQITVGMKLIRQANIALHPRCCHDYHRKMPERRVSFDRLQHLKTAQAWELQIKQHDMRGWISFRIGVWCLPSQIMKCRFTICNVNNAVRNPMIVQHTSDQFSVIRVIFHQ
jgi:hypothetical protein